MCRLFQLCNCLSIRPQKAQKEPKLTKYNKNKQIYYNANEFLLLNPEMRADFRFKTNFSFCIYVIYFYMF